MQGILGGKVKAGDVVVIRYEGPKGGPGMREMLAVTGALTGAGRGGDLSLIHIYDTFGFRDGRLHGGRSHGACHGRSSRTTAAAWAITV